MTTETAFTLALIILTIGPIALSLLASALEGKRNHWEA